MKEVLYINNLVKKIDRKTILSNISMKIGSGDVCGLIGKNGAGKTTLMKCILGAVHFECKEFRMRGTSNYEKKKQHIGSIIESPILYPGLSGIQNLKLYSMINGVEDVDGIKRAIDLSGINEYVNDKVKSYSLGMKQRLAIACSLIGDPRLIIWDEPINGLDPVGIKDTRLIIEELRKKGIAFLISSHILDEMYYVSNKFFFLDNGTLIREMAFEEIERLITKEKIIEYKKGFDTQLIRELKNIYGEGVRIVSDNCIIIDESFVDKEWLFNHMKNIGVNIDVLSVRGKRLEDVFFDIVEGEN